MKTTINLPKQINIDLPLVPKIKQITPLLDPIIHMETIDEVQGEQIAKGKVQLKPEVFYVYFPTNCRVDDNVYVLMLWDRNFWTKNMRILSMKYQETSVTILQSWSCFSKENLSMPSLPKSRKSMNYYRKWLESRFKIKFHQFPPR